MRDNIGNLNERGRLDHWNRLTDGRNYISGKSGNHGGGDCEGWTIVELPITCVASAETVTSRLTPRETLVGDRTPT